MPHRIAILVICDGHRPDFVTDDFTPVMTSLKRAGMWFANQRGIFPSATRASSASIATGCHPLGHGLRGNSMGLPIVGGFEFHDAGKPEFFDTYRQHYGRMLARPAIAQRVADLNGAIIASNASPGAAFFHDSDSHAHMYHRELCYSPGRIPTGEILTTASGHEGDAATTQRFIDVLLEKRPSAATLWLSEPDKSMHAAPLGSDLHLAALAGCDQLVGQVAKTVDYLREQGHDVLFMIGSDHGHESITEVIAVEKRLFEAGFKKTLDGPEIVVAPQGSAAFIHFGGDAASRRIEAVDWLRQQSWVEDVFMGEDLAALGQMPGNDLIAIDMAKTEGCNINGVPGLSAMAVRFDEEIGEIRRDCGIHGGRGRFETNPVLIAVGEGFEAGQTILEETSITDIAPSVLHHLGLQKLGFDGQNLQSAPG
jgi:hypothetical protein